MKKAFLLIAGVALVGGGFGAGYHWQGLEQAEAHRQALSAAATAQRLRENLEESVAALIKERDEAREQGEKLGLQLRELAQKLAESEANAAKSAASLARVTAEAKARPGSNSGGNPMKSMAAMFKSPEMKDAVIQQNLAQIDMVYGKLCDRLQLDGADRQDFKNLLAERMRAELEMSVQMMGGDFTPQQSAAAVEELNKSKAASDQKIRAFLNNETDYQSFQNWEQTKPERMVLNMGAVAFANAGEPLTPAQEDQLVSAMYAARTQAQTVPDMSRPENFTATNLGPEMNQKILANYDAQAAQVAAGAAAYLSPAQVEALKGLQKQQRAMQEMGLKMGAAMVGGK